MTTPPAVTLRPRTDADLDALYALAADLDTWEERGPARPAPLSRARWDGRQQQVDDSDAVSFVVDAGGELAGRAGLFDVDPLAMNAEAGIALLPAWRGRGVGTRAIELLVEFGFVRCNLHRIHLQTLSSNAAAIRAYEKAGFVVEGRQREHAWVRGRYEDIVRMGIVRPSGGATSAGGTATAGA